MQTGTYISGLGHIAVIGWVILGGAMDNRPPPQNLKSTNVSIVSESTFLALTSSAPSPKTKVSKLAVPGNGLPPPKAPRPEARPKTAPESKPIPPQARATKPDLSSVTNLPRATPQVAAPRQSPEPTTTAVGTTLVLPTARIEAVDRNGITRPDRLKIVTMAQPFAPKVDITPAPKPPANAKKSPVAQKATKPAPRATVPAKPKIAKAPEQAATEIVTEAKKKKKTAAPVRSSRPKGRPLKLAKKTARKTAMKTAAKIKAARTNAIEQAIAKDLAKAMANPAPKPKSVTPPLPAPPLVGPPLTQAEKEGLRAAVEQCWAVNPSSESARITVRVAMSMDRNGKPLASSIRLLSATKGPAAAQSSAFDAARRAILRCAKSGYKLPIEKYDRWQNIEMTFNPDEMRNK